MIAINAVQTDEKEIQAVTKVLKSGVLTSGLGAGPMVTEFENEFSKSVKAKYGIAMNTGTAALHCALVAAGVKPKDEVIVPSFTFVATAEVVVMIGAKPVFVDIDPYTYTITAKTIESSLTRRTKAVIPVHLFGLSADMPRIKDVADEHGLKVVEDAAQAHGATCDNEPIGAFGDAACWSFYGSKNMTTGEGGMITTSSDEIAELPRYMRSHGEKQKYSSLLIGHNYHMPEIEAAIGLEQLKKLDYFVKRRRENASRLSEKLKHVKALQLPKEPESFKHSYYLYTVRLKNANREARDSLVEKLNKKGIGAVSFYVNPVHKMPAYREFSKERLTETEKASTQVFSLPVHPGVTVEQIDSIAEILISLME